ncbi:hypothetical protein CC1G_08629 [Coprinopsis cinerea okayama7|uniref:Nucleolar 27S pre-rRNA processing Urb2/Npa2 C-terminal domain-containing protein n=1 Tax=Coprinopsis cinerea (strain Okayama-7 / 130 / ATCC MYA-4618 / FGSC 9003) TaxID=240176 RepID=A8N0T2_COPC7|nr:hypothetical protein CC1G_08629 [Coprinopsis cinerea okayama7\|eukprot:XP_001828483.2 hypothetical protein CC1G_08629 [Coprinopsis cinerea okayama7\
MTVLQSSQNFVRALKSPSDPPVAGGPLKIALAEQAWRDTSFRIPNKTEVIVDWLLTKFLKEKPADIKDSSIADIRYWKLLDEIISNEKLNSSSSTAWIKALLGRISVVPIVTSLLTSLNAVQTLEDLLEYASSALSVLWPLGTQKLTTEVLLGCWTTFLTKSIPFADNTSLQKIGVLITETYRQSLSNSSARKKIHTTFIQNHDHLKAWIQHLSPSSSANEALHKSTLLAGTDTLFNIDILRQIQDSKDHDFPLIHSLLALSKHHRQLVLGILPTLFTHYVAALRRHKSGLFSTGSSSGGGSQRPELNATALHFFSLCQDVLNLQEFGDEDTWTTACKLLDIVDQEHLYLSTAENEAASLVLAKNLELALRGLAECYKEERLGITNAIVNTLSALTRIDCDLILPSTPSIISRLLCIPTTHLEHFTFFDLLLEYHTKTRTLNDYISVLFSSLPNSPSSSSTPLPALPLTAPQRYTLHLSSPVLDTHHLEKLSRALHQFLTPGQCAKTTTSTISIVSTLHERFKGAQKGGEGDGESALGSSKKKKKKRKSEVGEAMDVDGESPSPATASKGEQDPDILAASFTLSSRLAQIVLGSLPLHTLSQEQHDEVHPPLKSFFADFVQHHISKSVKALAKDATERESSPDKSGKSSKRKHRDAEEGEGASGDWASQITLGALLRLEYALERAPGLDLRSEGDSKTRKRLVQLLKMDDLLPEFVLEITRILLLHAPPTPDSDAIDVLDPILSYIEREPPSSTVRMSWSGQPHQLVQSDSGRAQARLGVLHLLLERWLPVVDTLATPEQLGRLVKIIMNLPLDLSSLSTRLEDRGSLYPEHLLLRTLRSAHFWELHNLRAAFLAHLITSTSTLDDNTRSNTAESENLITQSYRLLLFFPVEYFAKQSRGEFVKRALNADRVLSRGRGSEASAVLRLFLERTFRFIGTVEQQAPSEMVEFLLHLLQEPEGEIEKSYLDSTLGLASLYILEIFRQCSKSTSGEIPKILSSYTQYPLFDASSHTIRRQSLIRMVDLITKELVFTNFSPDNQTAFRDLHSHLSSHLQPLMQSLLQLDASDLKALSNAPEVLSGWHAMLSLGRWLGVECSISTLKLFGQDLAKRFNLGFRRAVQCSPQQVETETKAEEKEALNEEWLDDMAILPVAIVMQELYYRDAMEQNEQLELGVAVYLSSVQSVSSQGRGRVDDYMGRASRLLSPESYGHVLELIGEGLSKASISQDALEDLIHLASVFLREHPQNTLKLTQSFVTTCINAFNGNEVYVDGPVELRLQVLSLLNQHCSERPAALRLLDISPLFLLLSKYLSPSPAHVHDPTTSPAIFHKLVSILNALVRLRRDLLLPLLPHLGMILRQLLFCMRSPRAQLGSKQTEMVLNSLPRWIGSNGTGLGVEEAKALSRLLETLTTKTVPRTHTSSTSTTESTKAESLSAPLSKHAAYILTAYISLLTDPLSSLSFLSLSVRKELMPGMYALCGMMNEHSRDSLMVSGLDAAGKVVFKGLWKEWEKVRYVGKG